MDAGMGPDTALMLDTSLGHDAALMLDADLVHDAALMLDADLAHNAALMLVRAFGMTRPWGWTQALGMMWPSEPWVQHDLCIYRLRRGPGLRSEGCLTFFNVGLMLLA